MVLVFPTVLNCHLGWQSFVANAQSSQGSQYVPAVAVANITVGAAPTGVVYDSENGYVYVASADAVSVIDGSNKVIETIPLQGLSNNGIAQMNFGSLNLIAYDSKNNMIYVASPLPANNNLFSTSLTIDVINAATNTVTTTLQVNLPLGSQTFPTGSLLYNSFTDSLYFFPETLAPQHGYLMEIINPNTNELTQVYLSDSLRSVVCDPSTGNMYGVDGLKIVEVSGSTNSVVSDSSAQSYYAPVTIVFDPENGHLFGATTPQMVSSYLGILYQTQIVEIDPETYSLINTINVFSTDITPPLQTLQINLLSLFFDQNNGLLYLGDSESYSVFVVDPVDSSVLQNVTAYGIPGPMAVNAKNGELYAVNTFDINSTLQLLPGEEPVLYTASTVTAIYVGGVESQDKLEIESYQYDKPLSEVPVVVTLSNPSLDSRYQYTLPSGVVIQSLPGAYANEEFVLTVTVKNTGQTTVASPQNIEVTSTSPTTDGLGEHPLLSSQLDGQTVNIAPGQTAQLQYQITATWNYAVSWNQIVADLPSLTSYQPQGTINDDLNTLLDQNNLGWYSAYADDNAQKMSQNLQFAPSIVTSHVNTPSAADLDNAAYGVASAFAKSEVVLGVAYSFGFPDVATSYGSTASQEGIFVLMPPNKVAMVDCLMIYYLDASSIFGPLDTLDTVYNLADTTATLYGIAATTASFALEDVETAASGLFAPDVLTVANFMFSLGVETTLIQAITDPAGDYTQSVISPSAPSFLADISNQNASQLLENLYYFYSYLNASVESNARANAALQAGSTQYVVLQTNNALEYANQSSFYLEKAIPMLIDYVEQPAITASFNQTLFEEAQQIVSQNPNLPLNNSTMVILQDFGLPTTFNFSQLTNENFTPLNATSIGDLSNPAAALMMYDSSELSYIQTPQSNSSTPSITTQQPQPSQSTSPNGSTTSALNSTIIIGVVVTVVVVVGAGSFIAIRRRKSKRAINAVKKNGAASISTPPQPTRLPSAQGPSALSPAALQKLQQLKQMLDKGLITQQDYDEQKKKLFEKNN